MDGGIVPTYTYRCEPCLTNYDLIQKMADRRLCPPCPQCGGSTLLTISGVRFLRSTAQSEPHFSHATGQVVTSTRDLEEQLKAMNDEKGTHYVLADPNDKEYFGVTDEGMDATERRQTDTGERESTLWL